MLKRFIKTPPFLLGFHKKNYRPHSFINRNCINSEWDFKYTKFLAFHETISCKYLISSKTVPLFQCNYSTPCFVKFYTSNFTNWYFHLKRSPLNFDIGRQKLYIINCRAINMNMFVRKLMWEPSKTRQKTTQTFS